VDEQAVDRILKGVFGAFPSGLQQGPKITPFDAFDQDADPATGLTA
jgi:hypothetical protein